jgi:hypothetical protein
MNCDFSYTYLTGLIRDRGYENGWHKTSEGSSPVVKPTVIRMKMSDEGTTRKSFIIDEDVAAINTHNHTNRVFNESAWKNARKPERASQMLPEELLKDLLKEFQYEPIACAEETQETDTDLIESVM